MITLLLLAQAVSPPAPPATALPPAADTTENATHDGAAPVATAAAPAPPPAPDRREEPAPEARNHGRTITAGLGAGYRRLYAVNEFDGEVFAGVGLRDYARWGYLMLHLEKGSTQHGLSTWAGRAGTALEWAFGGIRLGGEARVGFLSIARVTKDAWMSGASIGATATVAVDFAKLSDSDTLYAQAGFALDYYDPFVFGPTLRVGYRWDDRSAQ